MQLMLDDNDLSNLKPETRADLIATLLGTVGGPAQNHAPGFNWENVVDLSVAEVEQFMEGAAAKTRDGLKVFATTGPILLADALNVAGITNYGHFQGRVTQRTRTIKGKKKVFLFTWDDWTTKENTERGFGRYAISDTTYRSLRTYFKLG